MVSKHGLFAGWLFAPASERPLKPPCPLPLKHGLFAVWLFAPASERPLKPPCPLPLKPPCPLPLAESECHSPYCIANQTVGQALRNFSA